MAILSGGKPLPLPIQSLAETSPATVTSFWGSQDGMQLVDQWATYSHIYRSQPVVSGIIDKVADLAARLTINVQDCENPDAVTLDRTSAYYKLLKSPCAYMNVFSFWNWWFSTYELYGEVYGIKMRNTSGYVQYVAPMHPTRTFITRDPDGQEWFSFMMGTATVGGILKVKRSEVILSRRYNPDTAMRGLSRLEALTRTIQNEDAVRTAISATWQRGAQPIFAMKVEGKMSQPAMDRFREKIEERHSGPSKSGGILLLPSGIEPIPLQIDPQKMQLIESLKLTREEVCIRLDFPPPAAHILDHATFSNITEQMRSMYRDSMTPRLEAMESMLDFDLRPEFFPYPIRYAKFDLGEVLRGDYETLVESATKLTLNGTATPNEARALLGLPRSDNPFADELFANQAMQPLGTPVAGSAPQAPVPPSDTPPAKAFDSRSINGRIGRKVSKESTREQRLKAYQDEFHAAITVVLDEQRKSLKAVFEVGAWDAKLAKSLSLVALAVAQQAGRQISGTYQSLTLGTDVESATESAARGINARTMSDVNAAIAADGDMDAVFDTRTALLALTALTLATRWSGEGELDAGIKARLVSKTWVTGHNPRPEHASLNGETVPIREKFSNGARHPGDGNLSNDQTCHCNCSVKYA